MFFRLLGPLEVTDGDSPVRIGSGRQRSVLVMLLLHRNAVIESERLVDGLMMDDFPLTLTAVVERAEQLSAARKVVSRRPGGDLHRTTIGGCAERARRLATGLRQLGIGDGDPVATLLWNQPEHLELYFGVPLMGAVLHTLNPRLHPDELSFIVADAEDRAIVVDESLLDVFESFRAARDFEHVIVVSHSGSVPDGTW